MKVFISWSGPLSEKYAGAIRDWLPAVLQSVKPYFSPKDVEKGTRWTPEITRELKESRFGIICVTPDNLAAPWLLFEAGALSNAVEREHVAPVLFGLRKGSVPPPLSHFQLTDFEKNDMQKLIMDINKNCESSLVDTVVNATFEKWWPDLEAAVKKIADENPDPGQVQERPQRELLEEILTIARSLAIKSTETVDYFKVLNRIDRSATSDSNVSLTRRLIDAIEQDDQDKRAVLIRHLPPSKGTY